jgi:hypothetical protein
MRSHHAMSVLQIEALGPGHCEEILRAAGYTLAFAYRPDPNRSENLPHWRSSVY